MRVLPAIAAHSPASTFDELEMCRSLKWKLRPPEDEPPPLSERIPGAS